MSLAKAGERTARQQRDRQRIQQTWLRPGSQALSRHLADAGTHHLNRSRQRLRQERSREVWFQDVRPQQNVWQYRMGRRPQ